MQQRLDFEIISTQRIVKCISKHFQKVIQIVFLICKPLKNKNSNEAAGKLKMHQIQFHYASI